MAKSRKKKTHFEFAALRSKKPLIKKGASGEDVIQLQNYLRSAGYLGRDCEVGTLCDMTSDALRHFQKCYNLKDSGDADKATLELITRPRCGNPDISPETNTSGPAPFVLSGSKYNTNNLTYAFVNSTPGLTQTRQREIIVEAFDAWAAVSPLSFTEVAATALPTFPIAFHSGAHGDGSPFDSGGTVQGNVLAHAFFPPPRGGTHAGSLHFDEFEDWTDAASPGAIRLLNVAIHEIGHLLGLDHSANRNAIMFAFYADNVDSLRQDDIDGIQALYGPRPVGTAPVRGELTRTGASEVHRISTRPGQLRLVLRGPSNADFDLYARVGLAPQRDAFDARSFSGSSQEEIQMTATGGDIFVMVDSWRGRGKYELDIQQM